MTLRTMSAISLLEGQMSLR